MKQSFESLDANKEMTKSVDLLKIMQFLVATERKASAKMNSLTYV